MNSLFTKPNLFLGLAFLAFVFFAPNLATEKSHKPKMATEMPAGIMASAEVKTRLGTLKTKDGFPDAETLEKVFDNLDFQRGVLGMIDNAWFNSTTSGP